MALMAAAPSGTPGREGPGENLLWSQTWAQDSSRRASKQANLSQLQATRVWAGGRSVCETVTLLYPEHWTESLVTQPLNQLCDRGHLIFMPVLPTILP